MFLDQVVNLYSVWKKKMSRVSSNAAIVSRQEVEVQENTRSEQIQRLQKHFETLKNGEAVVRTARSTYLEDVGVDPLETIKELQTTLDTYADPVAMHALYLAIVAADKGYKIEDARKFIHRLLLEYLARCIHTCSFLESRNVFDDERLRLARIVENITPDKLRTLVNKYAELTKVSVAP